MARIPIIYKEPIKIEMIGRKADVFLAECLAEFLRLCNGGQICDYTWELCDALKLYFGWDDRGGGNTVMFNPIMVRRAQLRHELVLVRGFRCEKDGITDSIFDIHEGIVSRGDVRGWPKEKRALIFHEYNCFVLCRECHREHKLSREDAWKLSCERYGEEKVREWYEGLPWKAGVPRRFWNAN